MLNRLSGPARVPREFCDEEESMELCTYVGSRRRGQLFTAEDQRRYGSMSPCGSEQVSEVSASF